MYVNKDIVEAPKGENIENINVKAILFFFFHWISWLKYTLRSIEFRTCLYDYFAKESKGGFLKCERIHFTRSGCIPSSGRALFLYKSGPAAADRADYWNRKAERLTHFPQYVLTAETFVVRVSHTSQPTTLRMHSKIFQWWHYLERLCQHWKQNISQKKVVACCMPICLVSFVRHLYELNSFLH